MGRAAVATEARERAILLIRLAAAALGSTLVLLAGEGVLSLAAAVLLLYLAAAVVLRYSRISQGPTFIGPAIDLVAITALVFAFPLGASPWVLYAFPIGSSSLRFGPLGAIIATAASVVGLDLAFAARVDQARAIDLWAVQALIAIGLVTAEIAWALGRESADVLWSRLHARALGTLLRQRGHDELIRSVVGELARLPHVRGSWVWSLGTDQRLRLLASAGATPPGDLVVSAETIRALRSETSLARVIPDMEGLVLPLVPEPPLAVGVFTAGGEEDRPVLVGAVHDLVGDASQLVAAAFDRERLTDTARVTELTLRAIQTIDSDVSQPAVLASTVIEGGELGGGRAAIIRLADGVAIAGDLPAAAINQLGRDRRLPAIVTGPELPIALVALGEGRVLAVEGPQERLAARLSNLERLAQAARDRLALLVERDRYQRAAHELGRDVEHLGGALRAREDALATAVHELRNPLTAVHGYATLMSRNLQAVVGQLAQLERLMAELLETERRGPQGELSVDAVSETREAIARARVRSGADIELDAPSRGVRLAIDPPRFAQLLDNLLANAIKYSPESAPIVVRVGTDDGQGRVSVMDAGIGIAKDNLDRVFERFYRVEGSAPVAGQGLGLSICKEIVAAHGGRIWAESEGPGRGSTFTFTLPLAALSAVER